LEIAGFLLNPDLGFPNSQPPPNLRRSNTDRGTRSAKCTMGGAYTIEGKSSVWGKPLTAIRLRSGRRGRKRCLRCISARSVSERSTFRRTQVHKGTLSLSHGGLPDGQKRTGRTPAGFLPERLALPIRIATRHGARVALQRSPILRAGNSQYTWITGPEKKGGRSKTWHLGQKKCYLCDRFNVLPMCPNTCYLCLRPKHHSRWGDKDEWKTNPYKEEYVKSYFQFHLS